MKVKQLRETLARLPDDMIVILQKDAEGNGYSPLSGATADNIGYTEESSWSGEVHYLALTPMLKRAGCAQDDVRADGEPCLVLHPVV